MFWLSLRIDHWVIDQPKKRIENRQLDRLEVVQLEFNTCRFYYGKLYTSLHFPSGHSTQFSPYSIIKENSGFQNLNESRMNSRLNLILERFDSYLSSGRFIWRKVLPVPSYLLFHMKAALFILFLCPVQWKQT